jgi:hypothetical protein
MYIYGGTNATSLDIECERAAFTLRPVTPFSGAPHAFDCLGKADIFHYTSGRGGKKRQVVFEAALAEEREVRGVRLAWLTNRADEVLVEAKEDNGIWKEVLHTMPRKGETETYAFDSPVQTRLLRVILRTGVPPDDRVAIRDFDVLVSGSDFILHCNLDDHRDHRYSGLLPRKSAQKKWTIWCWKCEVLPGAKAAMRRVQQAGSIWGISAEFAPESCISPMALRL